MKEMATYSDIYDRPASLTAEELDWFHATVNRCKEITGCTVDIIAYNHDLYCGKSKDALGCCISTDPDDPLHADSYITIDTYFIHEMYDVTFNGGWNLSFDTLEGVIAHEIAHLYVWRHGKKHTALTQKLLGLITQAAA